MFRYAGEPRRCAAALIRGTEDLKASQNDLSARFAEADLRAQAADKDVLDLTVQISRDVRIAWLQANTAFQKLAVTERLLAQANEALRLAQARYDAGLGSIVELTQAQLTQVSAQIGAAVAKFDYLSRRALLDYTTGALR